MRQRASFTGFCLLGAGTVLVAILAFESPARGARPHKYPWPFAPADQPHPVANLFHTPLRPGTTKAYFHGGIDIRKPRGTQVLAVADGTIRIYREAEAFDNIVLTQKDGRHWEYRHLKPDSVPAAVRKAAADGATVKTGAVIGEVGAWDGPYDHIHLNRREKDGRIVNPLFELKWVKDTVPAVIEGIHFVPDGKDVPIEPGPDGIVTVKGKVDVVVTAIDRMDGETWGNPPPMFHLTIGAEGKLREFRPFVGGLPLEPVLPVPRYPRGYGLCVYMMKGPLACRNSIPRIAEQSFSVIITNIDLQTTKPSSAGCWDTTKTPDGIHPVKVRTRDYGGNWTDRIVSVRVENGA